MTALYILAAWFAVSLIAGAAIAIIGSRRKHARRQRGEGQNVRGGGISHFGSIASNPEHDHAR